MIWVLLVCKRWWRNWGRVISGAAAAADDRVTTHPPPDRRSSHASVYVTWVGTVVDVAAVDIVVVAVQTSTLKYQDLKRHNKSKPPSPKKNSKEKNKTPKETNKGRKTHSHESIDWESIRSISGKCSFFFPFSTNCPSYHEEREICRDFFFFFFFLSCGRVPEVAPNLAGRQTISIGLPNYFDFFARFEICLPIEWDEADGEEQLRGDLVLLLSWWCIARSLARNPMNSQNRR